MIVLTDFINSDKINKSRKSWLCGNPDCMVKTNVIESNRFKQVNIWKSQFHLTFLIKANKCLINWG